MSERRFTRSAARAVEEQTISVKREQQTSTRQAQQRAVRQTSEPISVIHIDVDELVSERPQLPTASVAATPPAAAPTAADELPALEQSDERKEGAEQQEEAQLQAKLKELALSFTLPPLELPTSTAAPHTPPPPDGDDKRVKKQEDEETKEGSSSTATAVRVKREIHAKVERKEKEEKEELRDELKEERGEDVREEQKAADDDSDDEPIAMRIPRRARAARARAAAAPLGRSRRVRRDGLAAQPDDSSSSSASDSDFEVKTDDDDDNGDEGDDDDSDDDDEDAGDELDYIEDEAVGANGDGADPLQAGVGPPVHRPPDEVELLLASTSPATFIGPFLHFAPTSDPPVTERYLLTLALSSRARCRRCREFIIAGYPRIGQHARLSSHLITRWYHPSCWTLTVVDDGRARIGGKLGALITAEERERVRRLEGRLAGLHDYEQLIETLNDKERAGWRRSLELLEKRKRDIEEWKEGGGVKRPRGSRKGRRRKANTKKKATAGNKTSMRKRKETPPGGSDGEWAEPRTEPKVKAERRVKREGGVKREKEGAVKREPRVKTERQTTVKQEGARVKRERVEAEEEKKEEDREERKEEGKRSKRKVKRE